MERDAAEKETAVEIEARSYEIDVYGHVNHGVYVWWMEHGRTAFLAERGMSWTSIPEEMGVHVVVVSQKIDYRAQVRLGDRLVVTTRLARAGRTSFALSHRIAWPNGQAAAEGEVVLVAIDAEGRPTPLPPDLRSRLMDDG